RNLPRRLRNHFVPTGKDLGNVQDVTTGYKAGIQKHGANRTKPEERRQALDKQFRALDEQLRKLNQDKVAFTNNIPLQDYLVGHQYSDPKPIDAATLANREEGDRFAREMNHTVYWWVRSALEQAGKEKITGRDEVKNARHLALQQGVSRKNEINAMHSAAKECQH